MFTFLLGAFLGIAAFIFLPFNTLFFVGGGFVLGVIFQKIFGK